MKSQHFQKGSSPTKQSLSKITIALIFANVLEYFLTLTDYIISFKSQQSSLVDSCVIPSH